ncbi:hypothetical protein Ancab_001768 [Ancistrocladus abbreviatus]
MREGTIPKQSNRVRISTMAHRIHSDDDKIGDGATLKAHHDYVREIIDTDSNLNLVSPRMVGHIQGLTLSRPKARKDVKVFCKKSVDGPNFTLPCPIIRGERASPSLFGADNGPTRIPGDENNYREEVEETELYDSSKGRKWKVWDFLSKIGVEGEFNSKAIVWRIEDMEYRDTKIFEETRKTKSNEEANHHK